MSASATRSRSSSATPFDDGAVIFVLREDIFARKKPILCCNARHISPIGWTVFCALQGTPSVLTGRGAFEPFVTVIPRKRSGTRSGRIDHKKRCHHVLVPFEQRLVKFRPGDSIPVKAGF